MESNQEKKSVEKITDTRGKVVELHPKKPDTTKSGESQESAQHIKQQWEGTFNAISEWIVLTDIEGRILRTNRAGEHFTGKPPAELVGQSCCKLLHGSDKHITGCPLMKMLQTGQRTSVELHFKRTDRWLMVTVDPVRDEKGNLIGSVHITRDITNQKNAEKQLRESEARYKCLFEQCPLGIGISTADGRLIQVNKTSEVITGYFEEELKKINLIELYENPQDRKKLLETIQRYGCAVDFPARLKRKDGTVYDVLLNTSRFTMGGQEFLHTICMDITEHKKAQDALIAGEKRYRSTLDNMLEGCQIIGYDWKYLYVNDALTKHGRRSREQLLGHTMMEAYTGIEDTPLFAALRQCMENRTSKLMENEFQFPDGSKAWFDLSIQPAPEGIFILSIDITERKRAEEKLRESEERFRGIYENALVGLYKTTPDGRILMANPALVQMMGYSNFEEIAERNLEENGFEPGYPRSAFKERIEKDGQVIGLESAWTRNDGTVLYVRESAKAIRDEQGKTLYYEGTVEDVTQRKKAEEALRESEQSYRRLIDTAQEGIWIIDTSAKTTYVNRQMAEMLGYSRQEILGRSLFDFMDEQSSIEARNLFEQRKNGIGEQHDFRFRHKNSSDVWTIVNTNPIFDDKGRFTGALAMINDITERKRAEDALRASEEKYRDLFENAREVIVTMDLNGKITNANRRVEEYGFKKTELMGKKLFDFVPEYDKARAISDFEALIAGNPIKGEMDVTTPKGVIKVEYSDNPIEQNGAIVGVQAILTDITERKKAMEQIEKLARFPAEDPNPVLRVTGYGTVVYANKSSGPLLKLWQCRVGGSLSGRWYDMVLDALSCGQNQRAEVQSGERTFSLVFAPVMESNYVNIYGRDITERMKAEQTLKASEERFKVLFESAPDGIYLTDLKGKFIDGNKAAEELTGYKREELIGKDFAESNLLPAEDLAKAMLNLKKVAIGEPTGPEEYTLKRKNGNQVAVEIRTYPIKIGNKLVSMGIARDITKRKKNEERLLEYQTQLKNLASKLSLTEERERRYIAEGLHDDIIQPLAFLDIKMDSLKKTIRDRDLIESCNEMQETIRELIKTSRAFTFDLSSPVLYELGLEAAIEEWLATNIRQKHKIETVFEDDGESKPLDNDMRASLFKAVKELLVNVVKHSKAGNVKVSVTRCEDKIQIRVEDNGVGFRPVEKKGLSGYGLFSIHERLDYFGGSFDIESEPEKGTRVTLTAPLKLDSISGKGANNEH